MPVPPERVIATLADVLEVGRNPRVLRGRRPRAKVVVQVPELTSEERRRLEGEIANYATACGCGQGRTAGILTLLVFALLLITGVVPYAELGWRNVFLLYLALSFATMLVGKVYGLLQARSALVTLCRELAARIQLSPGGLSHGTSM